MEHKTMSGIALKYYETIEAQQKEIEELKAKLRIAQESCLYTPPMHELTKQDFINVLESELNNTSLLQEAPWTTIAEYEQKTYLELDVFQLYDLDDLALKMCKKCNIIPRVITRVEPYVHTVNTYPDLILKQIFCDEAMKDQGLGLCNEIMLPTKDESQL
jgi:hypothetical protein